MTMTNFQKILGIILIAASLLASTAEIPKPSYTRTILKVARSLPGETEELKVRTSEGNVATLIVKRREKSGNGANENLSQASRELESVDAFPDKNENISSTLSKSSESIAHDRKDEVRRSESQQIEEIREKTSMGNFTSQNGKPEIAIISSNRSTGSDGNLPEITTRSSSINERMIDYGNWTPLSKDGRALETNESRKNQYSSWKPLGTIPEIIPNDRTNFARYQSPINRQDGLIFGRNFHDRETRNYEIDGTSKSRIILPNQPIQYAFLPHQARPLTRTNIGANLSKNRGGKNVPPEVIVRSEINVKSLPKRTPMSMDADGTPIIHGTRVPDEPMDKIQTWRNARVINNKLISDAANTLTMESSNGFYGPENADERQRFERFFKDVNRRYGRNFGDDRNVYFEWDPKTHQNSALNAEVYETRNENYRSNIQKRMLHPESSQIYPNSQMYTPESQKISPLALKPGARTPVLQYAHPELGVQPAKILKNIEKRRPENFPDNQNSFTEQRHKKKYVLNDKNVVDSYTLKNYYPNQHFYGLKQPNDQPFWVKISENLRNQFSTGVERVSQLTRPVFDPLVEATQKISQNLGLSRGNGAQDKIGTVATGGSILIPALGLVASGAALGIGAVAVGRYLDVDMLKRGRTKEDEGMIDDELELENRRALEAIETPWIYQETENLRNNEESAAEASRQSRSYGHSPKNSHIVRESLTDVSRPVESSKNDEINSREDADGVFMILEETEDNQRVENRQTKPMIDESGYVETRGRTRRSVDNEHLIFIDGARNLASNKRLRRTGPDSLVEIVEIDVPVKGKLEFPEILRKIVKKNGDRIIFVKNDLEINSLVENGVLPQNNDGRDDLLRVERIAEEESLNNHEEIIKSRRRDRRSTDNERELDDALQNLENAEVSEAAHINGDWTNTPCAKRIFCDAMIQRGQDASIFMEKKMDALLGLIQPGAALQVSSHFQEVMEAVRRHDCSSFLCPQARPGNVFF